MLLPLGDGHRRAERPGCCWCRASSSSLRCGAPLGSRLCPVLDKLQRMRRGSAAALSVYNLGNGDAAIHVQARKLDSYVCVCCPGDSVLRIGFGCTNVQRHLTSKQHWASYRQQVHGLAFDEDAWRSFAERASESTVMQSWTAALQWT